MKFKPSRGIAPCILSLSFFALPRAIAFEGVPFHVADTLGIARTGEVVTSGLPLAKGALRDGEAVHVSTAEGRALPTQSRVLGRWPDGTVKWLLVNFPVDSPANGNARYHLAHGSGSAQPTRLHIRDEASQFIVDTGAIRAVVAKNRMTLLSGVERGGMAILSEGAPLRIETADAGSYSSADAIPESVELEERGPVRATIRVRGWLAGSERRYRLDVRLRFYAGQPYVCAEYTCIVLGGPKVHQVREMRVDLRLSSVAGDFVMPHGFAGTLTKPAILEVRPDRNAAFGFEGDVKPAQRPIEGWALLESALGVAVADFRHTGPKAIELNREGIKVALWSGRRGDVLRFGRGRARTHHLLLDFGGSQARLRAFEQPLIATPDPEYFCRTEAMGMLSPEGAPATAGYDRKLRRAFNELYRQRMETPRESGFLHYGDYYHGGYGNEVTRGSLEYDTAHGAFMLWARSGRREYYDYALTSNRHFVDMDINHETGDQLFHGYTETAENHEEIKTRTEYGHVFVDGPADAYYLTGDERSLEAVRTIAGKVAEISAGEDYSRIRAIMGRAERNLGWPLQLLCRAYEVTGDERYLAAGRKIVEYVKIYARDPLAEYRQGNWWRSWMMDGSKAFMIGALHDGLEAHWQVHPDPELRQVFTKSLDWMIDHMWRPTGEFVYEFNAMNRPHRTQLSSLNFLFIDAFRFGYTLTGDRRYLAVALAGFNARVTEWEFPLDGKQFSIDIRKSPHTAAFFYREKLLHDKLPPAPQPVFQTAKPDPRTPRPDLLLRASFEGNLEVDAPAGKVQGGLVGKADFTDGKRGQGIAVGKNGYAWLPAPPEMLMAPGTIELWVRLNFKKQPLEPEQSAVFHVEGKTPLADTLGAMTIYHEMRVRMKDSAGHLNGTAEGEITQWNPGEWHHLAVTWDATRIRLYLDGKEQIRPDEGKYLWDGVALLPAGGQTRINLGWRFGNWYCDSTIDELAIHGRAFRPDEIRARFESFQ
ncbi:MAG TPA: LamG-like jellyroll fold domain-containing protein [Bryobacteraceae bacterium]|nr:LamG-like jellyroll fold domain-containing protein [Bryobacteraceae bacterium]